MHCLNKLFCCCGKKIYEFTFQNIDLIYFSLQLIWQFWVRITICWFKKSNQRGLFKLFTSQSLSIRKRKNNVKGTVAGPEPSFGKDPKPFLVLIYKATLEQNTLVLIYKVRCNSQKLLNDAQNGKKPLYLCKLLHCKMQLCGCETEDMATKYKS